VAEQLFEQIHALGGLPTTQSLAEIPAIALTCAAEVARAKGDATADSWLAAAAAWESLQQPYPRACCLTRAAETALTDRRRRADIAAWLGSAHEIASNLGAEPLADAVESLAQRGRVPLSPPSPQASEPSRATPLGLTPREIDVLRLIARGYTNARIADTLFISRKTASAHVSNILGKLDVSRRAEAAAIAARLGLLEKPTPQATT
jgi:DNA-binding NarL/FixJ family response regulator